MTEMTERQQHMVSVWDRHGYAEFVLRDPDAAIDTMCGDPYIFAAPLGQLLLGREQVYDFYANQFLNHVPSDVALEPTTRVVGENHLWDEFIFRFTHECEMPWLAPGVTPTGRPVELVMNVVVGFEKEKMKYEHLMWDHASLLTQLGVMDHPAAQGGLSSPALLRTLPT